MNNAPRLKYHGDTAKAATLKGAALGFYQFVLLSMGGIKTVQRDKQVGDAIIRVNVYTDAYGVVNGAIQIYVPVGGGDVEPALFCTSFNDTDLGAQIYKAPFPPKMQGELIAVDDNPNKLILPSPTYSARANYWVNNKETDTVSWDYVEYLDIDYPVWHINRKRKYGKIAIQGVENGLLWGKFFKPLACALIDKEADKESVSRAVIIYQDMVNYSGTGTKKYVGVYEYVLNTDESVLELTPVAEPIEFTSQLGAPITALIGFMGDARRLVVISKVERTYYPSDHPAGVLIHTPTINVISFNDGYSAIASNDIIYESKPYVSNAHNFSTIGAGDFYNWSVAITLITPIDGVSVGFIDVRGEYVSFATQTQVSSAEAWTGVYGKYLIYYPTSSKSGIDEYSLCHWSKKDGLVTTLLFSASGSTTSTAVLNEDQTDYFTTSSSNADYAYVSMYTKKYNEAIYSTVLQTNTSAGWEYDDMPDATTQTINLSVKSKKFGEIYTSDLSLGSIGIEDYAYTKDAMVASISAWDYDSQGNETDKSFTFISDMDDEKKVVQGMAKIISLTKLPKGSN